MQSSIVLGRTDDGMKFEYNLAKASNHNVGLIGFSGSGKTYSIKKIVKGYYDLGVTTFVIDIHDDIKDIDGIDQNKQKNIVFSYSQGNGSINPLRVLSNEGPYVAISNFIQTCKLFSPTLGSKQVSTLRRLTRDIYSKYGIELEDNTTWNCENPKLSDLLEYARQQKKLLLNDLDEGGITNLKKYVNSNKGDIESDNEKKRTHHLAELGGMTYKFIADYERNEEEVLDAARIDSVIPMLEDMTECGLFGDDTLDINRGGGVNRFVLSKLFVKDKLVMINLLLERIFNYAVRGYKKDNPAIPRMMIIFDEGKIAKEMSKSLMSPLNRISTEARGFGLGILMAVQSPSHLTDDLFENFALFLILKLHPSREKYAQNMFSIPIEDLQALVPKQDALIFFNHGRFLNVKLFA